MPQNDQVSNTIQYVKRNASSVSQSDRRVWELVSDVPQMKIPYAYLCAALNVIVSGSGTMLSAYLSDSNLNKTQLVVGFLQLLTSAYLIGWFLSIYWAYKMIMTAGKKKSGSAAAEPDYGNNFNPYQNKA